MFTQRQNTGSRLAGRSKNQSTDKEYSVRQFPVQREIQRLEDELNAFNERIVELAAVGHRGHAMEVLKANALDFARQIDELRCLLVTHHDKSPVLKKEPKWQRRKK
jgi:hypothetical protein